jgi:hypothetical protein
MPRSSNSNSITAELTVSLRSAKRVSKGTVARSAAFETARYAGLLRHADSSYF